MIQWLYGFKTDEPDLLIIKYITLQLFNSKTIYVTFVYVLPVLADLPILWWDIILYSTTRSYSLHAFFAGLERSRIKKVEVWAA